MIKTFRDRKQKNQKNWLNRLAEEADMIFDDDDDDDEDKRSVLKVHFKGFHSSDCISMHCFQ